MSNHFPPKKSAPSTFTSAKCLSWGDKWHSITCFVWILTPIIVLILHPSGLFPTSSASIALLSDKNVFGDPVSMRKMILMAFEFFRSLRQERETMRRLLFPWIFPSTAWKGTRKFSCWTQVVHSKSFCNFQQLFSGNVGEEHVLQRRLDVTRRVMNRVSAAFTCCGRGCWRRWGFHFFFE